MPIDPRIALGVQPIQIDSPMQTLMQVSQLQSLQEHRRAQQEVWKQQQEEREARIEERREKLAGNEALDAATKYALNEDGTFNRPAMQSYLVNNGYGRFWPGIEKSLNEAEKGAADNAKLRGEIDVQRRNAFGSAAATGLELPDKLLMPWVQTNLAKMVKDGIVPQDQAAKFLDDVPDDLEEVRTLLQSAVRDSPEQQRIINERARPLVVEGTVLDPTGTRVIREGQPKFAFQDVNRTVTFPDGKTYTGVVGYDPKTNTYAPVGSTTPFPEGTKIEAAPTPVDPSLAGIRDIATALGKQQLAHGGLTASQEATEVGRHSDDWRRIIAPVMERRGAISKIDTGLRALDSGKPESRNAAVQIIVTAFNKIQDEISVVREGEYARSIEGQALIDRMTGALATLYRSGGSLTDKELRALADEAKNVAAAVNAEHEKEIQNSRQAIEENLTRYNISHTRVFGNSTIGKRAAGGGTGGGVTIKSITEVK